MKKIWKVFMKLFKKDNSDRCPKCKAKIISLWSGVKCSKCSWWFCY